MKRELVMTYDEFEMLNFDEQQRLQNKIGKEKEKNVKAIKLD